MLRLWLVSVALIGNYPWKLSLEVILGPTHQVDEDILERWLAMLPTPSFLVAIGRDAGFQRGFVAAGDMKTGAERRHHVDAGLAGQFRGETIEIVARDRVGRQCGFGDHLIHRAMRQQ